jgi:hypothetical protein
VPANRRADHHGRRAGGERLDDVARVLDAAVGDHRHAGPARAGRTQSSTRDLGHADAGDHARGADRARADADLDTASAPASTSACVAVGGRDVAGDDLQLAVLATPRTVSMTFLLWPWAVSTTMTSPRAAAARGRR